MKDDKSTITQILEKELTEKIEELSAKGNFDAALVLVDEFIAKIGAKPQILQLQNSLKLKKKNPLQQMQPAMETQWKVVSTFDEIDQTQDSAEFKAKEVAAAVASQEKTEEEDAPREFKITDDDIMELNEEMVMDQKPVKSEKKPKEDTRPFQVMNNHEEQASENLTALEAAIAARRSIEFSPLGEPATIEKPPAPKEAETPETHKNSAASVESAPATEEPSPIIPPADKDFVSMLEAELSKAKKKPSFAPSFMKSPSVAKSQYPAPSSQRVSIPLESQSKEKEETFSAVSPSQSTLKEKKKLTQREKVFLAIAIVMALFASLYFLGIIGRKGTTIELAPMQTTAKTANPRIKAKPKTTPATSEETAPAAGAPPTSDQQFDQHLAQAEKFFNENRLDRAWESLLLAKKIKSDLHTMSLQSKIEEKQMELAQDAPRQKEIEKERLDDQAFTVAQKQDTRTAYEDYREKFPLGKHFVESLKRIKEIVSAEQVNFEKSIQEKARRLKVLDLRSNCLYISGEKLRENMKKITRPAIQCDTKSVDDYSIIIDFTTGLMWIRMERPMDYAKARLFTTRHIAGYTNWRLPTAEEAASLLNLIPRPLDIRSTNTLEIWTGDHDMERKEKLWTFGLPDGALSLSENYQYKILFAVRSILSH